MDKSKELVTVVVPCFNNETTISETIESVLAQTSPRWELICVDDGSQDRTVNIIKHYCEEDARVKLLIRDAEPKGGSHCRNIGAFAAKGEYLVFLDGDDLLSKICIENRLASIEETDYQFVVFRMAFFRGHDPSKGVFTGTQLSKEVDYLYYYASGSPVWTVTSPIIRKSFFVSLGGFNIAFPRLQDIEYNFRAIVASRGQYKLKYDVEYDCFYRYGSTGSSSLPSKHKMALSAYKQFLDMVIEYEKKGYLKNKKKLSKAFINIYCNAFIQYDVIRMKWRNEQMESLWIFDENPSVFLCPQERFYLFLIRKSSGCVRLNFYISRIISKLVRKTIK